MRLFQRREYKQALDHAAQGGQALLVHAWGGPSKVPCFNGAVTIGKLFDQERDRLIATVKRLGVRKIKVCREGQPGQHIDLVASPLERAKHECQTTGGTGDAHS